MADGSGSYEAWRQQRAAADAKAAAVASAADGEAAVTDLGPGFWMVSVAGQTRGFVTQILVKDEIRFEARLRHMNPGQGPRIGEYWELAKAVSAIVLELPKFVARDPFREITRYASRDEMRERTERERLRRRARRFML